MANQEFLASYAVEIDEAGVARLQEVLEENRKQADLLAATFDAATSSIKTFSDELGTLSGFSSGVVEEGFSGLGGLTLGLDTQQAENDLNAFIALAKKPIPLSANASGIVSAGRSAYNSVKSIFSTPVTLKVNIEKTTITPDSGDSGSDSDLPGMSTGGRFTKPTNVQVAEDGDSEYIIPVKKEDRAIPLLRQLLSELSPSAREKLTGGDGSLIGSGLNAANLGSSNISMDNRMVSAPVSIQVNASGANAEKIGQSLYDTTERYLLRTLKGVMV